MIDTRIAELAEQGMITPYHRECVQPCSYDVHLGPDLSVETELGFLEVDISGRSQDDPFRFPPGAFTLGATVESFKIPDNVEAHLQLVSTRARVGLQHAVSGLVDPGWEGVLTLELKNNLQFGSIPLYPGLRIAQLTFFEYEEDAEQPYRGRYFGDKRVSGGKSGSDLLVT